MLSLTTKFSGLFAAAVLAIGLAGAAPAATVSWGALPVGNSVNMAATVTSGNVQQNVSGTVPGQRKSPWPGNSAFVFSTVAFGFAEYAFSALQESVSFVWGTPDKYNSVEFRLAGVLVDSVAGFGNGQPKAMPFAMITNINGGMGFDAVRFVSKKTAFEYGNLVVTPAPIPVPAAGLLLLTAVGGIAALRRRKAA